MRSFITISGKQIVAAMARQIRNVMSKTISHASGTRLHTWFLLQRLAGTALAQRVAVPVYRRRADVGVTRRSPARLVHCHSRRVTGHPAGPGSWDVGARF